MQAREAFREVGCEPLEFRGEGLFSEFDGLVTVWEAYGGRLAIEATMQPSSTEGGSSGRKVPVRGGMVTLNQRLKMAGEPPLKP
jgi:hypothetical protein